MASQRKASKSSAARRGAVLALCALGGVGMAIALMAGPPSVPVPPRAKSIVINPPAEVPSALLLPSAEPVAPVPDVKTFLCVIEGLTAEELTTISVTFWGADGSRVRGRIAAPPRTRDGAFVLSYDGATMLRLQLEGEGFDPLESAVVDGRCVDTLVAKRTVPVRVRVLGPLGEKAWVEGCEAHVAVVDRDVVLGVPAGRECVIRARRLDGVLEARSDEVTVRVSPPQGPDITVTLPHHVQGGIGAQLGEAPNGLVLLDVRTDGPGAAAGLRPGDVITRVNGETTAGWRAEDFQAVVIGDAGTDVELTALRDERSFDLVITRGALDDGKEPGAAGAPTPQRPGLWMGRGAGKEVEAIEWERIEEEVPGVERLRELGYVE